MKFRFAHLPSILFALACLNAGFSGNEKSAYLALLVLLLAPVFALFHVWTNIAAKSGWRVTLKDIGLCLIPVFYFVLALVLNDLGFIKAHYLLGFT
jgi:hypothetical protein